jgi:hypothetical protein
MNSSLHISIDPEIVALLLERVCMPETRVSCSPERLLYLWLLSFVNLEVVDASALKIGKIYLFSGSKECPIPLKATGSVKEKTGVYRSVSSLNIFLLITTLSFMCHLLSLLLLLLSDR